MKFLLLSYSACLLSLGWFGGWRRYKLVTGFLVMAIPATLLVRFPLPDWYPVLLALVAILRLLAGLEVLHRQTEGFWYWGRLNGIAWVLAGFFTGICWMLSVPATMGEVVEARRDAQIWMAAVFVLIEGIWLILGGGWWRQKDLIAVAWGLMTINHAVSSVMGLSGRWQDWAKWWDARGWLWTIDAILFGVIAGLVSGFPVWRRLLRLADGLMRAWFGSSQLR